MDRQSLCDHDVGEYDVTVVISAFEADRQIPWTMEGVMQSPLGDVYGYRLDPTEDGALVTSYDDWSDVQEICRPPVADIFPVISETNLRATLGILARSVAPGAPPKRTAKGEGAVAAGGEQ